MTEPSLSGWTEALRRPGWALCVPLFPAGFQKRDDQGLGRRGGGSALAQSRDGEPSCHHAHSPPQWQARPGEEPRVPPEGEPLKVSPSLKMWASSSDVQGRRLGGTSTHHRPARVPGGALVLCTPMPPTAMLRRFRKALDGTDALRARASGIKKLCPPLASVRANLQGPSLLPSTKKTE